MNPSLSFFVEGRPAPGGSKTAFAVRNRKTGAILLRPGGAPIINVTDAGGAANKEWKKTAAMYARSFMRGSPPLTGALKVEFVFYIRRPKSHYRTGKFSHILRDDVPPYHTQAPDALKYARGTEDALSKIVWNDDSQTVRVCSEKRWMQPGDKEGCAVRIVVL